LKELLQVQLPFEASVVGYKFLLMKRKIPKATFLSGLLGYLTFEVAEVFLFPGRMRY
jgi:hypothetical protein